MSIEEKDLARLRAGDEAMFVRLTQEQRTQLILYCYRMVGSLADAEDLAQETLWRAWRALPHFEGRSSLRTWLYQIATHACLDLLKQQKRRSLPAESAPHAQPNEPLSPPEPGAWVDPLPGALLVPEENGPEARYTQKESVALAFLVALQHLPPKQRAALLLCDVLSFQIKEVADLLETTEPSISSALHRARTTLQRQPEPPPTSDARILSLLKRYLTAWESGDLLAFTSLLREDAIVTMPPTPSWYTGRASIEAFYQPVFLPNQSRYRLLPLSANGQEAFAVYRREESSAPYLPFAIKVLTITQEGIARIDAFAEPALFPRFQLPDWLSS